MAHAKHYYSEVLPAMKAVRDVADKLETIVADDIWPLPTYARDVVHQVGLLVTALASNRRRRRRWLFDARRLPPSRNRCRTSAGRRRGCPAAGRLYGSRGVHAPDCNPPRIAYHGGIPFPLARSLAAGAPLGRRTSVEAPSGGFTSQRCSSVFFEELASCSANQAKK